MNDFAKRQVSKGAFSPWSFQGEGLRGEGNRNPSPLMPSLFYFLGTKKVMKKGKTNLFLLVINRLFFAGAPRRSPTNYRGFVCNNRLFFARRAPLPYAIEV